MLIKVCAERSKFERKESNDLKTVEMYYLSKGGKNLPHDVQILFSPKIL